MERNVKNENQFTKSEQKKVPDIYDSVSEVLDTLHKLNFGKSNLIIGIDVTRPNIIETKKKSKKDVKNDEERPYEYFMDDFVEVLSIVSEGLIKYDDDQLIPLYAFGGKHKEVINMKSHLTGDVTLDECRGLDDAVRTYKSDIKNLVSDGVSNFRVMLEEVRNIMMKCEKEYHILIILTHGQVSKKEDYKKTKELIKKLCKYPLSIVTIGIGDNKYDEFRTMLEFDDDLKGRKFDNFQFVDYVDIKEKNEGREARQEKLLLEILREIPVQYSYLKEHSMI